MILPLGEIVLLGGVRCVLTGLVGSDQRNSVTDAIGVHVEVGSLEAAAVGGGEDDTVVDIGVLFHEAIEGLLFFLAGLGVQDSDGLGAVEVVGINIGSAFDRLTCTGRGLPAGIKEFILVAVDCINQAIYVGSLVEVVDGYLAGIAPGTVGRVLEVDELLTVLCSVVSGGRDRRIDGNSRRGQCRCCHQCRKKSTDELG